MEQKRRYFQGFDRERLERNVEEFKRSLGDRFITLYFQSNNPQWVIVVEYWEQ